MLIFIKIVSYVGVDCLRFHALLLGRFRTKLKPWKFNFLQVVSTLLIIWRDDVTILSPHEKNLQDSSSMIQKDERWSEQMLAGRKLSGVNANSLLTMRNSVGCGSEFVKFHNNKKNILLRRNSTPRKAHIWQQIMLLCCIMFSTQSIISKKCMTFNISYMNWGLKESNNTVISIYRPARLFDVYSILWSHIWI